MLKVEELSLNEAIEISGGDKFMYNVGYAVGMIANQLDYCHLFLLW
ncbi:MAG: hypothetical protein IPM71_15630 [Bacteroidota bacterium]|nr:MAG: hypothetical protein IPM71_15630 [Bacteroidota bacterium]